MEDQEIVNLFWQRDEKAIAESQKKYRAYLIQISMGILNDREDAKECVNDVYLKAWHSIPPQRPLFLLSYLGKMVRQISIDRYRKKNSLKRKNSQYALSLLEWEACFFDDNTPDRQIMLQETAEGISAYLRSQPEIVRNVFLARYYDMDSIKEISKSFGFSQSKVKSMLMRTRNGLKDYLKEEELI